MTSILRSITRTIGKIARGIYHDKRLRGAFWTPEKWCYELGILSGKNLDLPDFLGIGAPKAGTTWLYRNLRAHPSVHMADDKELSYFNHGFHKPVSEYAREFNSSGGLKKGEITPGYSTLPARRIRFIRRLMPEVRLVYILRNPIERAWSHALFRLVKIRKIPFERLTDEDFLAQFRSDLSRSQNSYRRNLDQWLSVFPREQLYVGFFDDIATRPREVLSEIFSHIGITTDIDWRSLPVDEIIYEGPGTPMPNRYRDFLRDMYDDEIEGLYERFGEPIDAWRSDMASRNSSSSPVMPTRARSSASRN